MSYANVNVWSQEGLVFAFLLFFLLYEQKQQLVSVKEEASRSFY